MSGECMIARVARAIAVTQGDSDWRAYLTPARAAVLAMREPTAAMLQAAIPDLPDWGYLPDEWRAMIDHVVAEQPNLAAQDCDV
jgi:hypothetical protein